MRILWVGKASHNSSAGDEVYDRKVIACIRAPRAHGRPSASATGFKKPIVFQSGCPTNSSLSELVRERRQLRGLKGGIE